MKSIEFFNSLTRLGIVLVVLTVAANTSNTTQQQTTEMEVIVEHEFTKINDQSDTAETRITWINATHLIELVSYLIDQKRTSQSDVVVIDTRSSDEYNGWQSIDNNFEVTKNTVAKMTTMKSLLKNKNGHIGFAHNLDSDWLDLFNESALNDFIEYRYGLVI